MRVTFENGFSLEPYPPTTVSLLMKPSPPLISASTIRMGCTPSGLDTQLRRWRPGRFSPLPTCSRPVPVGAPAPGAAAIRRWLEQAESAQDKRGRGTRCDRLRERGNADTICGKRVCDERLHAEGARRPAWQQGTRHE